MARELQRVLATEDDPDIRHIVRLALERMGGLEVAFATGLDDTLSLAREFGPDMILLDVLLESTTGPDILAALREAGGMPVPPVVFVTASVDRADLEAYGSIGAAAVIAKPFDPVTLADRLREIFRSTGEA